MRGFIKGQSLSVIQLPDFAQDKISNDVTLVMGIGEIERLVHNCRPGDVVKLGPPGSQELVMIMNSTEEWIGQIDRIYWAVNRTGFSGGRVLPAAVAVGG